MTDIVPETTLTNRPAHLAHHFDSSGQQFSSGKLGMWLFLATEVLFFGGLFVFYAVTRANHPEVFEYGSQFLDVGWGMINTCVLIISSFFVAMAVWAAQCNRKRELIIFLTLTLICAVDFLGIKYVEYSHKFHDQIFWGAAYVEASASKTSAAADIDMAAASEQPIVLEAGDLQNGRLLFRTTCAGCHGPAGAGLPNSGKPLTTSEFIADRGDPDLLDFLKKGRMPNDPANTTGILMPPRGGNMMLSDQELMDIIAHLRVLQDRASETGAAPSARLAGASQDDDEEFFIPKTVIPPAATGPPGLNPEYLYLGGIRGQAPPIPEPRDAHLYFSVYYGLTGLHGIHVVVGMVVISWLLVRAMRGRFSGEYFTPIDLGALYWHLVDLIWIFLFPLLYLI